MTTFSDRLKEAMYAQNLKQIDLVHIAAENNVKLGKSQKTQKRRLCNRQCIRT